MNYILNKIKWANPTSALLALLICDLLLLLPTPDMIASWAALSLAALLPGHLLVTLWLGGNARTLEGLGERFVYGVGVGYGLLVLILLGLSYLPGGLTFAGVALTFNAVVMLLIGVTWWQSRTGQSRTRLPQDAASSFLLPAFDLNFANWQVVALLALLLGAGYLRFTHLSYSELHGDEALVALRAVDVIQGWERALFIHKKGPGEILIGTALYVLTGRLTEYAAHLPFALASWTGVLATYLLGRRWFGPVAGWWAGAMVAVDGYLMAFGRMLQYQSIIFLTVVLTVLAMQLALDHRRVTARYLLLAAFIMATGLLAHYEASIAAVPALWLLICLWRADPNATLRQMGLPLLVGSGILAIFYIPFILDPEFFRDTFAYIFDHRLAGHTAPEGPNVIVGRSTLYSSSYYFWSLVVLTVAGLVLSYQRYAPARLHIPLVLLLVGIMTALLIDATTFFQLPGNLPLLMFSAILAPVWFSSHVPRAERTAWLWFGVPLLGILFFVRKPGTHVYIFFIPWALVTGMVVGQIWQAVRQRWGVRTTHGLLAPMMVLLVLLFGNYVRWLFVVNDVEVLRTWDENRPPGYWTAFETPAFESIFGFPIRNGWKTVATLYDQGQLTGRFDTNDRFSMVPDWYVRGAEYCPRDEANYYMLVPYPLPVDRPLVAEKRQQLQDKYYLWGTVTANDQPHMAIYARKDRVAIDMADAPRVLRAEDHTAYFNARLLTPFTPNGPLGAQPIPNQVTYQFGEQIALLGYSVDRTEVTPGGELRVELYWRTNAPLDTDYFVSIQIINLESTRKAGQRDGEPGCNRFPTTSWVPGDHIFDRLHVPIAANAKPGDYALYVNMYQIKTTDGGGTEYVALPVTQPDGQVASGATLTAITVMAE